MPIMGDELELPRIEPKGKANLVQEKYRYNSIVESGQTGKPVEFVVLMLCTTGLAAGAR